MSAVALALAAFIEQSLCWRSTAAHCTEELHDKGV